VARCAATALGDLVNTFMPSVTGVAQAGSGFGAFSTSDQAHAAIRGDGQFVVIGKSRECKCRPDP